MKRVIILENKKYKTLDQKIECFGNFKKLCIERSFPYHSLKMLKFPIEYKDHFIYKVDYK